MNAFDASQDPLKPSDFPENWLMTTPGQQAYVSFAIASGRLTKWEDLVEEVQHIWEQVAVDMIAVPGVHKCHKCGFIQTTKILHPDTGRVGMDTTVADRACPNDGQLMIPLTWKEQAEGLERIAAEYLTRINAANIALSQLQGCITELANASIENVQRMSKAGFPISEETQKSMDQITKLLALKPPQV